MAKVRFGRKNKVEFNIPEISNFLTYLKNETIFVFGSPEDKTDRKQCIGLGRVCKVEKGDELDLVYMNFGRRFNRKILVKHNHARRQIYTLKKGELAWFKGEFKVYNDEKGPYTIFFAYGFQAWFVPKAMDIKHYDLDTIEELEKENETSMINFLDEIIGEQK